MAMLGAKPHQCQNYYLLVFSNIRTTPKQWIC